MFSVLLTDTARRFYESVDARLQRRLDRCFRLLRESPLRHPNVKPLKGRWAGYYRFRSVTTGLCTAWTPPSAS